ncbi:glycosyltransferase [Paenibacillus glycanilyticus]|uniref:glycosyltransferase n=1 Tax=Paenibacillus glycanilyticus TaxID=126569 RepID=UPI00288A9769|nr:glycosyltransferase [Paenibacillus glycanilyticus]
MRPSIKRSNRTLPNPQFPQPTFYVPVKFKFVLGHCFAAAWLIFSIYISKARVVSLGHIITIPLSIIVITGIAYIPGYMISFLVGSLLMDRQPRFKVEHPREPVTVLIAAWNEEKNNGDTLRQLAKQDYEGAVSVILVDNNCTDNPVKPAWHTANELGGGQALAAAAYLWQIFDGR